ncbi:hypothetical protein ACFSTI_25000 [Rhizorhabdus histidinilytica]|jgi:hypothetical protein|uniref:Uncharacterized protein n=1 Tax=Rhizorhabdus histidinilytica TaxID=439228 RepID=A0A1T5A900_9SPHN|nr:MULTISPECIES: hypothetical protein [Rhizorhabdus]SKB31207.1 hypothetical protein SAMN06295920_101698 [Rhizorhabdus histidinilytica]
MTQRTKVCQREPIQKDKFQRALAAAWGRVWPAVGKGTMAAAMGLDSTKTIDRAVTASNLPEAHTIFNSLFADPTALYEVAALYGFKMVPMTVEAANDLSTAAGTIDAMAALIRSQDDSHRDHNETLAIAALLRPHLGALNAIVRQADELRGAA